MGVVTTATAMHVEQAASDIRIEDLAAIFVLQFKQAAAATTVTQSFPFTMAHLMEWFIKQWIHGVAGITVDYLIVGTLAAARKRSKLFWKKW